MAFLNSRYTRFTLTDAANPANHLKASGYWVGPALSITTGFLVEPFYVPELHFIGSPGVQISSNNLSIHLAGVSPTEYISLTSLAANLKASGRMIVIPRPAAGVALLIAYTNHITTGSMITASSAAAAYPDDNLANLLLYSQWQSATAALSNITLTADLGSSNDIDILALLGTNLTDAATMRVQAGEASNFSTTEYDSTSTFVSCFDTTYSASVLLDPSPPFGRHVLWAPGLTQLRALWHHEAIYCTWDPEQPITRSPQPTFPETWVVELRFKMCQN